MAAQQELGSSEVNKSVSEETFLDVTMKSKGSSTPKKSSNPPQTKKEAGCSHYLKGICKHGRIGKECFWQHPKLCFAFTKSDDCKKDSCEYLHPKLCKHSIKKEICEYESKCKFFHIKTCRKNKEVIDENKMIIKMKLILRKRYVRK